MQRAARAVALRSHPTFASPSPVATRLWLDKEVTTSYSANACWGFDEGVGMTWFDLKKLHAPAHDAEAGAVLERGLLTPPSASSSEGGA